MVSVPIRNEAKTPTKIGPLKEQHFFAANSLHFMLREFAAKKCGAAVE